MTLLRTSGPKAFKIFVVAPFTPSPAYIASVQAQFPGTQILSYKLPWGTPIGDDFPIDEFKDVTVLLTSTFFPTPEQAPQLQYVQLTSAGANQIFDKPLFKAGNVPICTANGVHGPQISEWVITTFLNFQHNIYDYLDLQKQGKWSRSLGTTQDAYGKRVGIMGYGSIGRQLARVATAMGMEVYAYTLHPRSTPESRRDDGYSPPGTGDPEGAFPSKWFSGGEKEDIHAFIGAELDLLVVATPLTEKTRHLISKEEFEVLSKKGTFLSNIARGPVVNTDDLIEALDKGLIRGAALDVTDPEPLPEGHPLWSAKNVFVSPHISGLSEAYYDRVSEIMRMNLGRLSEGGRLVNKVNRKEGY